MRPSGRKNSELRPVSLETGVSRYAEGSCLVSFGHTRVLCTATVEESTARFLKGTGKGWVTAEYGMLPRATHSRVAREAAKGKQSGRTQEIQRLIGRSLRACVDLAKLGERQIIIDCDVIEADGGTRTAAITGGYVALALALRSMRERRIIHADPLVEQIAAVSCGVLNGQAISDLDYQEDSTIEMDANFVLTPTGGIVEIQCTAEQRPVPQPLFDAMFDLARTSVAELAQAQNKALL